MLVDKVSILELVIWSYFGGPLEGNRDYAGGWFLDTWSAIHRRLENENVMMIGE